MKEPPAQPGHLAKGKPFLKKQEDDLSVKARKYQTQINNRLRFKGAEQLSAPLDWTAPKKPKKK